MFQQNENVETTQRVIPAPETVHTLIMKGGGVKGLAFTGAVEILHNKGYRFDTYVGVSAGSIAAIFLAADYTPKELRQLLRNQSFSFFLEAGPIRKWLNLLLFGGMHSGDRLIDWIEKKLSPKFSDSIIHPIYTMMDLRYRAIVFASHPRMGTLTFDSNGEHREARISHAVRLSSSIPGLFIPEKHDGYRVYDGGLLNNFPVEIYQRVRGKEKTAAASNIKCEDFIALYIGSSAHKEMESIEEPEDIESEEINTDDSQHNDQKKQYKANKHSWWSSMMALNIESWWFVEIAKIMLARDETTTLDTYKDRSLILNTYPISTTDFDLSNTEKDYLIEVGRHAALEFLMQPEAKNSSERLSHLRIQVDQIRQQRKFRKAAKLMLLTFGIIAIAFIYNFAPPPVKDVYSVTTEKIRHKDTYIDSMDVVQRLGLGASKELASYAQESNENSFLFDAVFQVVNTNPTNESSKVVVWYGHYPTESDQKNQTNENNGAAIKKIIMKAAGKDKFPKIPDPYIFVPDKKGWKKLNCKWHYVEYDNGDTKITTKDLALNEPCLDFKPGDQFWLVQIAKYDPVFQDDPVVPWALYAHQGVKPTGKAAYLLLSDENSEKFKLEYITNLFVQENNPNKPEITLLKKPKIIEPWNRTIEVARFIKNTSGNYSDDDKRILVSVFSEKVLKFAENRANNTNWWARLTHGFNQWKNSSANDESKAEPILYTLIPFDEGERKEVNDYKLVVFAARQNVENDGAERTE